MSPEPAEGAGRTGDHEPAEDDLKRYVVLFHEGMGEPHFDFLFEWTQGEPLTSFRCPAWPPTPGDAWAERADHRRIYLEYEGPVSGGRGVVARRESGVLAFEVANVDPPSLAFAFEDRLVVVAHEIDREVWRVQSVGQ